MRHLWKETAGPVNYQIVTEADNGTGEEDWMVKLDHRIVFMGDVFECCRFVAERESNDQRNGRVDAQP